ncbi:hypothetical protein MNBD_ALPHA06-1586 [hydrothermal vent metagenome]|uniref:Glycerophosphoryl diester phosphodiesterase membrane domain-containing protein n=1 Tax=hydrothermal vent metagenome TaxID=652676 RepID=A0A3B0SQP7_9ZZZZ
MTSYSISDAVFFATSHDKQSGHFKRLALVYVVAKLILLALFMLIALPLIGPVLESLPTIDLENANDITALTTQYSLLSNAQSLSGILFFPIFLSVTASFLTWAIKDEWSPSRFGLKFGQTEMNLFVVYLALFGMFFVAFLVMMIPMVIIISVLSFSSGDTASAGMIVLVILAAFAFIAALIWFGVRLSLALAMTVREDRIVIFESFAATKGHFWKLFGSYLLLYVIAILASIVLMFVILLVAAPFVGAGFSMFDGMPQVSDYGKIFSLAFIPMLIALILATLLEYWLYMAGNGITAYFLRWKDGDPAQALADVFGPEDEA